MLGLLFTELAISIHWNANKEGNRKNAKANRNEVKVAISENTLKHLRSKIRKEAHQRA